jgi:Icc-related predicted phosphoesterase
MRVVVISDTHNKHAKVELPEGDVLVHCGDATGRGREKEIAKFITWFEAQPHEYKILIAGNHDWLFQKDPLVAQALVMDRGIFYLEDSSVVIDGVLFYGSPWQPWFCDWAFNLERGPEIAKKWAQIPKKTEFLITHGPPKGILDRTCDGDAVGCWDLLERIKIVEPAVHAFGHIHEGYGTAGRLETGRTLFVNACICDEDYVVTNAPVVLVKDGEGWHRE